MHTLAKLDEVHARMTRDLLVELLQPFEARE
jgi:hypothetical protein